MALGIENCFVNSAILIPAAVPYTGLCGKFKKHTIHTKKPHPDFRDVVFVLSKIISSPSVCAAILLRAQGSVKRQRSMSTFQRTYRR